MLRSLKPRRMAQSGVALLIAIFALVLISAVAISLIVSAGVESGINNNYRRSTVAFYSAQGGLEELRERLVPNAPDTIANLPTLPNPQPPNVVPGQVLYIVNPAPGDPAFNPQSDPPTSPYYDNEYASEFGFPPIPNPAQIVNSSGLTTAGGQPPLPYKWARITLKSEAMGGVDLNNDGLLDPLKPVLVQGNNNQCVLGPPNCTTDPNALITTAPVYRMTSFALEPGGGRRLLQADVARAPIVNPNGAIASQASVTINGNFNAFGGWPPIVTGMCSSGISGKKVVVPTCGVYSKGQVVPNCNNLYDATTDTCLGPPPLPRSHNDYCNQAPAVNGVVSGGAITAGASYSIVPEQTSSCATNRPGCVFTTSPNQGLYPNYPNWPYDMDLIIQMLSPPVTEPITNFSGITCGTFDQYGNRTCNGQGATIGTLPSPWPPPPNTPTVNNVPRYAFADVGADGLLKLTGASSGSGILVVNGDLTVEAGFQWFGLIIAHGVVTFLGGGSTPTNIFGGVLAGKDINNANTTTGGSVSIVYDSCAYRLANKDVALRYLDFREITCTTNTAGITTCK